MSKIVKILLINGPNPENVSSFREKLRNLIKDDNIVVTCHHPVFQLNNLIDVLVYDKYDSIDTLSASYSSLMEPKDTLF